MRMAMMAITTSSSISVNPGRERRVRAMKDSPGGTGAGQPLAALQVKAYLVRPAFDVGLQLTVGVVVRGDQLLEGRALVDGPPLHLLGRLDPLGQPGGGDLHPVAADRYALAEPPLGDQ